MKKRNKKETKEDMKKKEKGIGTDKICTQRTKKKVLRGLWMIVAVAMMVMVMVSCTSTRYVPVETVRTEVQNRTDTILQIDTVEREKTVTIIEADSELLAKYGVLLRQNRNTQNAYLVLQKEVEREKSKKQEMHTDTVVRTEIVEVPVPVERKLSKWEQFCLDYGKVTTGGTLAAIAMAVLWLLRWLRLKRR